MIANADDAVQGSLMMRSVFHRPIRLLEYNRPAHSPWLTPSLVEQDMAVQAFEEAAVWRMDEGWDD